MRKKSRGRRVPKAEKPAVLPVPEESAPEEVLLPTEEEQPILAEEEPSEGEAAQTVAEDDQTSDEPDLPDEPSQPEPPPEEPTPKPRKVLVARAHPLWRGWWLAICLLSIAVLMGQVDTIGVAWRHQPWRAFGGAVAAGGFLAALPGLIKGRLPERPTLRRCLLGLLCGAVWGVLG